MSDERLVDALDALTEGRIVVITGDRMRDGDIDFCVAARHATPESLAFMAAHGRGLICLALTPARAEKLGIAPIAPAGEQPSRRPLGRSIGAARGVATGGTHANRAQTIAVAIAENAAASDLVSPGSIFPLVAAPGGVRERPAAAEAAIELCRRAGAGDAAVICSVLRDDGEMARRDDIASLMEERAMVAVDIDFLLAD